MPQPQQPEWKLPPIPAESIREGSRWRHHRPSAEEVYAWFETQPLDADMAHADYVAGVVLIPQSAKEKYRNPYDSRQTERFEDTFTPYVQVGTRIAYFRRLAAAQGLVSVIKAARVPLIEDRASAFYNGNMERGYWWHVIAGQGEPARFLCCTMRVAFYDKEAYLAAPLDDWGDPIVAPLLEGRSTKQVGGGADLNQLAKAQTSAIGRALGVAGILVLGTGVATAEDMLELGGAAGVVPGPETATLPGGEPLPAPQAPPADPNEAAEQLRNRIREMQSMMMAETPDAWKTFAAWYSERAKQEGWSGLEAVPPEGLRAVVSAMERGHAEALANAPAEVEA